MTHVLKFELPWPVSSNSIYSGLHRSDRTKIKDAYHWLIRSKQNELPKIKTYPVAITYDFEFKKRAYDTTNTSFMAKLIEDGLCHSGTLKDDSPRYVSATTLRSKRGKSDIVTISIEEKEVRDA